MLIANIFELLLGLHCVETGVAVKSQIALLQPPSLSPLTAAILDL